MGIESGLLEVKIVKVIVSVGFSSPGFLALDLWENSKMLSTLTAVLPQQLHHLMAKHFSA